MNLRDELRSAVRGASPEYVASANVDLNIASDELNAFLEGGELPLRRVEQLMAYFDFKLTRGPGSAD